MGNTLKAGTTNWSVDDWAFGTGENAVSPDEVLTEASKLPARYFGGKAIENDASIQQMQHDLLSFDDTIKNLFRRKKKKKSKNMPTEEQYYADQQYYEEQQPYPDTQQMDRSDNHGYLQPTFTDTSPAANSVAQNNNKLIWRCTNCAAENKTTEEACKRCGLEESRF